MDERRLMLTQWEAGATPSELAREFGVTRPTVYATIARWDPAAADEGLEDRPRTPHSNPRQTTATVTAALLNRKDRYPHYGPDKLVRLLLDEGIVLSSSTARDILRRNGRVQARRARPARWSPAVTPKIVVPGAGHTMSADHKGGFRLGNGRYCYPLTVADPASRFVMAVDALHSTAVALALPVFERLFREWGLPEQIITDNGCPFCSARSIGGLTELSKYWIRLGIQHVRIEPGRPQQNGIHERMHRTLKQETTKPPERDLARQQKRFDAFREEFNNVRPHQALGQETPVTFFEPYRRSYPERLPSIEYPSSFQVRRVRERGNIKWHGELLFVSEVLRGELVALQQVDTERWRVYYSTVHLATWNERTAKYEPPSGL